MAARKRTQLKPRSTPNQNGSSSSKSVNQSPGARTETISGTDLTTWLRLCALILLLLALGVFLLYPDITNLLKAVRDNTGQSQDTQKHNGHKSDALNSDKRDARQHESLVLVDEGGDITSLGDDADGGDLMEDETNQKLNNLTSSRMNNLKNEAKQSESSAQSASETKTINKRAKDKTSSAPSQERKDNLQKDQYGEKSAPIILNAQNNRFVLEPSHIKVIDASSDQTHKVKDGQNDKLQGSSKSQKSTNNNNKSNEKVNAGKQPAANADTKTQKSGGKINNKNGGKGAETADNTLQQAKTFNAVFQKTFTPKKIFADGRRIPPIELLNQKESNSSVRVFLFNDFLSQQECDGLIKAHDSHVKALSKPPLICFDSVKTLRRHIKDAKQNISVTPKDFTQGTRCLNASFSLQLQTWMNSNWSYSTAFYPGESTFSKIIDNRIQEAMGLNPANGGKFQITSYPEGKAYKEHTDCTLGGTDQRDRVVSVLMYLSDVEDGGETRFPHLGIWVKPRKARALVWNNMSPNGVCDEHSKHVASVVNKGSKYILIRWYYYKNFYSLGRRPTPPSLPEREPDQAMVSCDEYNSGSCRWYDEWSYDALLDYGKSKHALM